MSEQMPVSSIFRPCALVRKLVLKVKDAFVIRLAWWLDAYEEQLLEKHKEQLMSQFAACGTGVRIGGRITFWGPEHAILGNNVHINDGAFINASGGLVIGDNTHIGRNLVLFTTNHNYEGVCLPYDDGVVNKPVSIGRNVWIGINVCIVPGTTIGDGAIIGMGTTVFGHVPPLAIVGAGPWRVLRYRDEVHYHQLETREEYGGYRGRPLSGQTG